MKKILFPLLILSFNSFAYDRTSYNYPIDYDGDCQNTRAEFLIKQSTEQVTFTQRKDGKNCTVATGKWVEYYTQKTVYNANELDIDHIVPLANADKSGASLWTVAQKTEFANNFDNIVISYKRINAVNKKDKDLSEFMPANNSMKCDYMKRFVGIKKKYNLELDISDLEIIKQNTNCLR